MIKLGESQRLAVWSALWLWLRNHTLLMTNLGSENLVPHSYIFPMCHLEMHYIVGICAVASSVLGMTAVTVDTCPPHTVTF